jgi:hypothetical protein
MNKAQIINARENILSPTISPHGSEGICKKLDHVKRARDQGLEGWWRKYFSGVFMTPLSLTNMQFLYTVT